MGVCYWMNNLSIQSRISVEFYGFLRYFLTYRNHFLELFSVSHFQEQARSYIFFWTNPAGPTQHEVHRLPSTGNFGVWAFPGKIYYIIPQMNSEDFLSNSNFFRILMTGTCQPKTYLPLSPFHLSPLDRPPKLNLNYVSSNNNLSF